MRKILFRPALLLALLLLSLPVFAGNYVTRFTRIPGLNGNELGAVVLVPEGSGKFPLIVMPSSWGLPSLEYVGRGTALASRGYIVVSYTSRGFWDSQGQIDIAGAATVEDVSAVIDWALANTPADANRIGASGISYGAGVSLLAAERDPRIKAVAALSGWGDLKASLYANQTVSQQAIGLLVTAGGLTGRPGPELSKASLQVVLGDWDGAVNDLLPVIPQRSPVTDVGRLDNTAVLLANAFNDGLFPPNQLVDFFQQLGGPKQLMFSQGDHATAELPGALGLPNEAYAAATRWFDRHLKGLANGVDNEPTVRLRTLGGNWLSYANWAQVQAGATTYALNKPSGLLAPTGSLLASGSATGWSHRIYTGIPTVATSGVVMLTGAVQALIATPPVASIPLVNRGGGAVWIGPSYGSQKTIAGTPSLRVTVTPSQANVSLFAYLYRQDVWGNGYLITHKPYSLRGVTPGMAKTVNIELDAAAAELPAGQRLVLVIDTNDLRYSDATSVGGSVNFSSPASAPSQLVVPLR